MSDRASQVVVMASGGIDSAVLLHHLADEGRMVQPLFLRQGTPWEEPELAWLRRFLAARERPAIKQLEILTAPLTDLYEHGRFGLDGPAPKKGTPDADVYLPGRNLTLLAKAGTYAALHGFDAVALAPLDLNPFPDGTPEFFAAMANALSLGLGQEIEVLAPFRHLSKIDVVRKGAGLPLELTFSCSDPQGERHCGRCSKCWERHSALLGAGRDDPTVYDSQP